MLPFKLKVMKWKPDFIGLLLAGALVGKEEADLKVRQRKRLDRVLAAIVFVKNAAIKFFTKEALLVQV